MNHSQVSDLFTATNYLLDGGKDANFIKSIKFLFVRESLDFDLLKSILISVTFPRHKEHFTVGTRPYRKNIIFIETLCSAFQIVLITLTIYKWITVILQTAELTCFYLPIFL